ncbi:MAG: septum formation protein Maf [Bacilli bacterium]|nr:septum formation protein Maf [Bacilli bacterium]
MKIVLATTSKFKNEIMDTVGIKHSMIESDFNEDLVSEKNVYEYVKKLALGKASSVKEKVNNSIIIGLDTINYVDGIIQEKPKDLNDARKNIEMCRNKTTKVITGICIIDQKTNEIINTYAETKVTLRDIDDIDIDYYMENEPNIMYASGFILETILSNFIDKIEGSYYNILGVPVEIIYKYINDMGYNLKDMEE